MRHALLASAAFLALAGNAFAQDAAAPSAERSAAETATSAPAAGVSEDEVKKMATIAVDLNRINTEHQAKIAAAADAAAKTKAQNDLNEALAGAVDKSGLDIHRYNEIAGQAQKDPALAARIVAAGSATATP